MPELDYKCAEEIRTCYALLAFKRILMVSAIVLISTSTDISLVKPCDLEKALDSLGLGVTSPCTYNVTKDRSTSLCAWGIGVLVVNFIFFIMILYFKLMSKKWKWVLFFVHAVAAILFACVMLRSYNEVLNNKAVKTDNFDQFKSSMINLLKKSFTSDNISSSNPISNRWNKFFIEYNCCAINQVTGTTNDFDSTPWCTTSGSCQATASQIPKTCCNYVSEDDYGSAPTACHSSVTSGTFKSNCMIAIRRLSVTNIEEYKITLLEVFLLIIGILEIAEVILVLVLTKERVARFIFKHKIFHKEVQNENKNDGNGATNRKTSTGRNESLTETTENENQNNANG